MSFFIWLISLSIIFLRSISVFASGRVSSLFRAVWYFCVYSQLLHPFIDWVDIYIVSMSWLMLIMLLWRWRCRYLFELLFLFPLDIVSGIELLDCVVVLFVTFWGTPILLSVVATPIYNPTNSKKGFLFLCVSTHLFDESHCNRHEVISHLVLICISLMTCDAEQLFMNYWLFIYLSLEDVYSDSLSIFKLDYLFLLLTCMSP